MTNRVFNCLKSFSFAEFLCAFGRLYYRIDERSADSMLLKCLDTHDGIASR